MMHPKSINPKMKRVMSHRYAKSNSIKLLDRPEGRSTIAQLNQGTWIGVMEQAGEWLRVITTEGYGWIKADLTIKSDDFKIRVLPGVGGKLKYAI
jgi:hypothetical protein